MADVVVVRNGLAPWRPPDDGVFSPLVELLLDPSEGCDVSLIPFHPPLIRELRLGDGVGGMC